MQVLHKDPAKKLTHDSTLKYEHLFRCDIPDGDALAVEANLFRQTYDTIRPHQALGDRTPRQASVDRV